jgi:aquaporin Z
VFYIAAQFTGGALGVLAVLAVFGNRFAMPPVQCVATLPGVGGPLVAFLAEAAITFILMATVLVTSNSPLWSRYTGVLCGLLLALYITFEAPLSGMSLNPARSFASAAPGALWDGLWIYFVAPPLGMALAAEAYVRAAGVHRVFCAKLNHQGQERCIFHCRIGELSQAVKEGGIGMNAGSGMEGERNGYWRNCRLGGRPDSRHSIRIWFARTRFSNC